MKTKILLLIILVIAPLTHAQTQWVLQPFLQYFGYVRGTALGARVKGFVGSHRNNPYNVAVAESHGFTDTPKLRFYTITSPQDTTPRWVIPGADVEHGDFNGDGLTDFAVWKSVNRSRGYDTVLVYLGNSIGIGTIPSLKIPAEKERSQFGARMCVGDLNNDRIDDLVITAELYQKDISQGNEGKIYVYFGRTKLKSNPDFTITGSHPGARLGSRCTIGDFNYDGFNDLAIRGNDELNPTSIFGYLNVYFGSAQFDTVADLVRYRTGSGADGLAAFDANGDQKIDLLLAFVDSLSAKHSVFIHYGGNDFKQRYQSTPDFIIPAPTGSCDFGNEICNVGDINGDSDNDLLIAANCTGQGNGIVFVYSGGNALDDRFDAARGQSLEGAFGSSVSSVGDINHDGYSDIIIGAPNQPWTRYEGYFGIFLGDSRVPTSVEAKNLVPPFGFALHQNYPNPIHQHSIFEFSLPQHVLIEIKIYNILGKELKTLINGEHAPGQYEVYWNGKDQNDESVPNGVYFCRMRAFAFERTAPIFDQVKKFTVVR